MDSLDDFQRGRPLGLPQDSPRDRFNMTYIIFFMLGTGCLLPWNVFITETAYFGQRFKIQPTSDLISDNYEAFITVSYQCSNISTIALVVYFEMLKYMGLDRQIASPLIVTVVLMSITCAMVWVPTAGSVIAAVTLLSCLCLGFAGAVLNGGVFGLASYLPPQFMQGVMAGQAMAGLVVAMTSLFTTWVAPSGASDDLERLKPAAFTYFMFSLVDLVFCIVGYYLLYRIKFFMHFFNASRALMQDAATNTSFQHSVSSGEEEDHLAEALLPASAKSPNAALVDVPAADQSLIDLDGVRVTGMTTAASCWYYRLAVMCNFLVTLSVFPSITGFVASTNPTGGRFFTDLFVPFSYVVFNAGDLIGRCAAGYWPTKPLHPKYVALCSLSRAVFIPLLMLCNVVPPNNTWPLPVVFHSDAWPILFNLLLAITNGHVGSVCMMHGPAFQCAAERGQEAATLSFALTTGITLGCVVSLTISISCQHS